MRIELDDGKYTYVINEDGSDQHALRYGERWRDLVGDNFVLAMAHEIDEKQKRIAELENIAIESAYICFMLGCKDKLEEVRCLDKQTASNIKRFELNLERLARSQAELVVTEQLRKQAKRQGV